MTKQNSRIVCYIPAIHQGYLDFIAKHNSDVYVLNQDLLLELEPRLERDIRAVNAENIVKMLKVEFPQIKIEVLGLKNLNEFIKSDDQIIMPEEDVTRIFADNNLKDKDVVFEPAFLRWNRHNATLLEKVVADKNVSQDVIDAEFMALAVTEAQKSPDWWRQVGAVTVKSGKLLMATHNKPYPTEYYTLEVFGDPKSNFGYGENIELSKAIHGEASLIATSAKLGLKLEGCDLYVTTFPCPVCAKLVAEAGFARVFYKEGYSLLDGEDVLKAKGIEIIQVIE